jgi:hypothetical protein
MSIYYTIALLAVFGILWAVGLAAARVFSSRADDAPSTSVHQGFATAIAVLGGVALIVAMLVFDLPIFESSSPLPFSDDQAEPSGLVLALLGLVVAGFAGFLLSRPRETIHFSSYLVVFMAGKIGDAMSSELAPHLKNLATLIWGYIAGAP